MLLELLKGFVLAPKPNPIVDCQLLPKYITGSLSF